MRSWMAETTAFGVVVRIEHVFTQLPLGSFQRSQIPANVKAEQATTEAQSVIVPVAI